MPTISGCSLRTVYCKDGYTFALMLLPTISGCSLRTMKNNFFEMETTVIAHYLGLFSKNCLIILAEQKSM